MAEKWQLVLPRIGIIAIFLDMDKPHIYTSEEIANAVNVGCGVDDHLRNCKFVKLTEHDEYVKFVKDAMKYNIDDLFDERDVIRSLRRRNDFLQSQVDDLLALLAGAINEQQFWIPCSVMKPKYGVTVFVNGKNGKEARYLDAVEENDEYSGAPIRYEQWFDDYTAGSPGVDFEEFQYWMPMPKEPEEYTCEDDHVE
jgi:hypothetical protein